MLLRLVRLSLIVSLSLAMFQARALVPFGFWKKVTAAVAAFVLENKLADTVAPAIRILDNGSKYGRSVAISEDQSTLVVGAPYDDLDESGGNLIADAGAVYVYIKSGADWVLQQKLVGTGGTNARITGDWFGHSVAISGDTIVVGAYQQDYDGSGGGMLTNAGAAYVFTRTAGVWSFQQKIVGTGTNGRPGGDLFGISVGISGDTIVVGAHNQDYDESGANMFSNAGAAYVFTRTAGVWSPQQKLVGMGSNGRNAGDSFGENVGISGDTIVVGAAYQDYITTGGSNVTNAGAAYVFTRTAGVWSQQQKLVGTGTNGRMDSDFFGESVAISGDTVVVAATGQDYDASGGNLLSAAGAIFVFTRTAGTWSLQQKLVGAGTNGRLADDGFGSGVGVSGDRVIVGAFMQDYDSTGGNYFLDAGASFVNERNAGVWVQTAKLAEESPRNPRSLSGIAKYGNAVAISEDQSTLVVGVPDDDLDESGSGYTVGAGAAFVYIKSGGNWVLQQKLVGIGTAGRLSSDNFGYSIAISGDTIVVGAPYQDYNETGGGITAGAGAAYVFTRTAGVWSQQQKLVGTGTNGRMTNDNFGNSVGISGETIVVGAYFQDYDEAGANLISAAGAAYVFTRTAGVWSQQQKLVGTGANGRVATDNFGSSVAISGDTLAVGAELQDYDASGANFENNAGAAYVYKKQ